MCISNKSCSGPQEQVNRCGHSLLTDEKVGIRGGSTVLLLQELVEEGGETRNDRGEAALSKHQEDKQGVEEQLEEDLRESCEETSGKASFSYKVQTWLLWLRKRVWFPDGTLCSPAWPGHPGLAAQAD